MEALLHGPGIVLLAVGVTWGIAVVAGQLVARRRVALWVWDRAGLVGRVLVVLGLGLAIVGLTQSGTALGASLVLVGALLLLAGLWLVVPLL